MHSEVYMIICQTCSTCLRCNDCECNAEGASSMAAWN